jgi:hypothetical protein
MRRGELARASVIAAALAGLGAFAYVIGTGWQSPPRTTSFAPTAPQSGSDPTAGSIVFMPPLGGTCRQNLIDNRTWEVREGGAIPCEQALGGPYRRANSQSGTRLDIIRDSFRKAP